MKNSILTLAAVVLAFGAVAQENKIKQTAGSDNTVTLTQKGTTKTTVTQTGNDSKVFTFQEYTAGAHDNSVDMTQSGARNKITIDQIGQWNSLTTTAAGNDNKATITQTNNHNDVKLYQTGSNNTATFTQNGTRDNLEATQSGTYSTAIIKQIGVNSVNGSVDNNLVEQRKADIREGLLRFYQINGIPTTSSQLELDVEDVYQGRYGTTDNSSVDKNSSITLTQKGLGDVANIYQGYTYSEGSDPIATNNSAGNTVTATQQGTSRAAGEVNTLNIYQSGTSNTIEVINQAGTGNQADLKQSGTSDEMIFKQDGTGLKADFTQSSSLNKMNFRQEGSGNELKVTQAGSSNIIKGLDTVIGLGTEQNFVALQSGTNNKATFEQDGSGNVIKFSQTGSVGTTISVTQNGTGNTAELKNW